MELYEKRYGEWYEQRVDYRGVRTWRATTYAPSAVREAARPYSTCRVEYDCGHATVMIERSPMDCFFEQSRREADAIAGEAIVAYAREQDRIREEATHREVLRRARRDQYEAAVVGGALLGKLISDLVRGKK